MPRYKITETAVYYVDAETPEDAMAAFLGADGPSDYFSFVEDRDIEDDATGEVFYPENA